MAHGSPPERSPAKTVPADSASPQPATVAVISHTEDDRRQLEDALAEAGLASVCHRVESVEGLGSLHQRDGLDLVVVWSDRNPIADPILRDTLAALARPPALLLAVDQFEAPAYVRAGALNAEDVITTRWLGHLELAVRRTLHTQALRHELTRAQQQLTDSQIVDRSTFTEPPTPDAIPPLVEVLDEALRNDRLHLVFQPIVAVNRDAVDSFEVFVRLHHEGRDMLPDEFLPLAARYGLLPALDRWVVRNAVTRFMDERQSRETKGGALRFFLNVSAHTLVEERAAESLLKIVARARPRGGEFVIKVDKGTLLSRLAPAKTLNRLVKKVGLQFALDHDEHSDKQLNFLEHVAVDYIKLHGSTTHGIDQDPRKRRHVLDILAAAHAHDIGVIASQVERPTDLVKLYHLGVDYVQGFQVAPPETQITVQRDRQ